MVTTAVQLTIRFGASTPSVLEVIAPNGLRKPFSLPKKKAFVAHGHHHRRAGLINDGSRHRAGFGNDWLVAMEVPGAFPRRQRGAKFYHRIGIYHSVRGDWRGSSGARVHCASLRISQKSLGTA